MHSIYGFSYKYHERAMVLNHKNLVRLWDVCYDGYNGGKDCTYVNWTDDVLRESFKESTYELIRAYEGASMMVMRFKDIDNRDPWPSPVVFHDANYMNTPEGTSFLDGEHQHQVKWEPLRVFNRGGYQRDYHKYFDLMPNFRV